MEEFRSMRIENQGGDGLVAVHRSFTARRRSVEGIIGPTKSLVMEKPVDGKGGQRHIRFHHEQAPARTENPAGLSEKYGR